MDRDRETGKICSKCGAPTPPLPNHMYGERLCGQCQPRLPRTRRVLMNFLENNGWSIHFIAEDCKTPISRFYTLSSIEALYDLVRRTDPPPGTLEEVEHDIRRWNRGSVYLNLTEAEYRKLRR